MATRRVEETVENVNGFRVTTTNDDGRGRFTQVVAFVSPVRFGDRAYDLVTVRAFRSEGEVGKRWWSAAEVAVHGTSNSFAPFSTGNTYVEGDKMLDTLVKAYQVAKKLVKRWDENFADKGEVF